MPRRKLLIPALLISVAIPLAGAAPASAGSYEQCGDSEEVGFSWWNLRAKYVQCKPARALADHYVFEASGNDDGYKRWRCRNEPAGYESVAVKCKREKADVIQRAKFKFGS